MIGSINSEVPQPIGINPVSRRSLTGIRLAISRLYSHLLHQCGDMLSAHLLSIQFEEMAQHSYAHKGHFQMELVDLVPQSQILL